MSDSGKERRRFFRITETIGIGYRLLDDPEVTASAPQESIDNRRENFVEENKKLERLLDDLAADEPKIAAVLTLLNQKMDRLSGHVALESQMVERIAHKSKEASISACGVAFENDVFIEPGTRLALELILIPSDQKVQTRGIVVGCDAVENSQWYWRIDFAGIREQTQEQLIQFVVQSQSQQLKRTRGI